MSDHRWTAQPPPARGPNESRRAYIVRRDQSLCAYCGRKCRDDYDWDDYPPDKLSLDHVVPTSRGGTDRMDNVVVACLACNNAKGQMTAAEFRAWMLETARRILARHEQHDPGTTLDADS